MQRPYVHDAPNARVAEFTKTKWKAFGLALKAARIRLKLTQVQLAAKLKLSNDQISRLENGGPVLRPVLLKIDGWIGRVK